MANVNINTKPTVTTIDNNDQIFISDDGVALKKINYTDLAKAIIEQYNASQLAGSAQSVKSALDVLNSNMNNFPYSGKRLHYYGSENVTISEIPYEWALAKGSDSPDGANFWYFHTFVYSVDSSGYITNGRQIAYGYQQSKKYDIYDRCCTGGTWSDWVKRPTRNEINALNSKIDSQTSDTAGFHNGIYRGKDITSYLTNGSLWNRIKGAGGYKLFEDLYLGDYITVGSNSFAIVDFDYYLRCGSVDMNEHHIVMMPVGAMNIPEGTALYGTSESLTFINTANAGATVNSQETATAFKWNATMDAPNTHSTKGGYKYSRMRTVVMKAANTIVINAFGAAHVKPITVIYPNPSDAEASGLASGWAWFDQDDQSNIMCKSICDLPNETQVYGQQVWGRGSAYTNVGYEVGTDKFQFAIFALHRNFANYRGFWWLRSVYSASSAASVTDGGRASSTGSAVAYGVRPRFLLVG